MKRLERSLARMETRMDQMEETSDKKGMLMKSSRREEEDRLN